MVLCTVLATILEGRHFLRKRGSYIFVEGRFYNESLTTERSEQTSRPLWDTELEWTLEHKTLHLLRTQKATVKLTCYSISKEKDIADEIGFVVLDLRQVQNPSSEPKPKWFPLVNVKKGQRQNGIRPELRILFQAGPKHEFLKDTVRSIRQPSEPILTNEQKYVETLTIDQTTPKIPITQNFLEQADTAKSTKTLMCKMLTREKEYQIGSGPTKYLFFFGITFFQNLSSLFRSSGASHTLDTPIYFQFKLFDREVITEKFFNLADASSWSPTRIFVNIQSSLSEIQEYFARNSMINIYLCQDRIIGCARVSINDLFQVSSGEPHFFEGLYALQRVPEVERSNEANEPQIGCSMSLIEKEIINSLIEPGIHEHHLFHHYLVTIHLVSLSTNDAHLEHVHLEYSHDWFTVHKTIHTKPSIEIPSNTDVFLPNSFYTTEFFSLPNLLLSRLLSTPLHIKLLGKLRGSEKIHQLGSGLVDFNTLLRENDHNTSMEGIPRFADSFDFIIPVIQDSTQLSIAKLRVLLSILDVGFVSNLDVPIGFTTPHINWKQTISLGKDHQYTPLVISHHLSSPLDTQANVAHRTIPNISPSRSKMEARTSYDPQNKGPEYGCGYQREVEQSRAKQIDSLTEEIENLKTHIQLAEQRIQELNEKCIHYERALKETELHRISRRHHESNLKQELEKLRNERDHYKEQYERCQLEKTNYRKEWINATLEIAKWKLQNQLTSKDVPTDFISEEKEIRRAERKLLKHLRNELKSLKARKSRSPTSPKEVDPSPTTQIH